MYFYLLLLAMAHAILGIQMRTNQFYLVNTGNPSSFNHSVYIFTHEECHYTANILDNSVLQTFNHALAPHGCFLSDALSPTMYWNGGGRSNDCSQAFQCVVGDADDRDTFFYGERTVKNISDKRQTQQQFEKQFFDATPTILTQNDNVTVRQDDCKTNCDSNFNNAYDTAGCQHAWEFKPHEETRTLFTPSYQSTVDMFIGLPCNGNLHCEALCNEDTSCMGYSSYNQKSTGEDWPETTTLYGGTDCLNEQDCINNCVNDDSCNGYTEYWWPVLADAAYTDTEEIPAELCTIDLLPLLYPSGHQFEDTNPSYDTGSYYRSTSTENNGVLGCQIIDDTCSGATTFANPSVPYQGNTNLFLTGSKSGNCHQYCYTNTDQSPYDKRYRNDLGYNIFYSDTGSISSVSTSFSTNVVYVWYMNYALWAVQQGVYGTCSFNRVNRQIRKRSKWTYGPELATTTSYFTNSRHYTFNDVVFQYGLKSLTIPQTLQLKQSNKGTFRFQDNNLKNNEYSLTEQECASIAAGPPYDMWSEYKIDQIQVFALTGEIFVGKSDSNMISINSDKLPYGCIVSPTGKIYWNNDFSSSNFKQCGLFKIQTYDGYDAQSTLSNASGLSDFLIGSSHYSVTCLQHPLVSCTWTSGGGAVLYEKDLSDFPTTNSDIAYVQSDRRISLLHPIKKNAEDALRYCLDLCDRTKECFYATIGDDNACEMYRKCESTSASSKALYRKVPYFLNLSSTLSDQVNDYYYDIGVLDNTCAISEPRPECYLDYCNRHKDIKKDICGTLTDCTTDVQLHLCKDHWNTTGSLDNSRNFDPTTECTRSLVLEETSIDADCPTFCINTEGCNIAYQTEDACYALPKCTMSSGEAKGHVITKIVRDQHYYELFPYNTFWPCDAVVLENTDIDACVTEARRENRFVFSYNTDTRKCLIYEHYVENAYDELMDHGINATWCYSNNVLQNAITSLGTCSAAVQNEDNQVLQVVDGAFETLVANPNHYDEVTSGLPDMSVSSTECSSMTKYAWGGFLSNINEIKGCYLIPSTATVYYNTHTGSVAECNLGARACIQRKAQDTCIDQFTTLTNTATIELSSNLLTYLNVVDALTVCFETPDCNYIVKYTAQQQIVLAKEVTVTAQTGVSVGTYAKVNKLCDLPPNACIDLETRAITSKTSGYADTSIVENFDNYTRSSVDCQSAAEELGYDYKGKYREVTSGEPDLSLSQSDCEAYGLSIDKWGYTYDWTDPSGCVQLSDGRIYYNTRINSNSCSSIVRCIQKLPLNVANGCVLYENNVYWNKGPFDVIVVANSFDACSDSDHCFVGKPEVASDFTPMVEEVTSGAPDLSLSESECETYGESIGKWNSVNSWEVFVTGCFLYNNNIYYNRNQNPTDLSGGNVCQASYQCIQKKQLSLENCMIALYKLGKEAGHHGLGANIDGTGAYTGGTCWYKNNGKVSGQSGSQVEHAQDREVVSFNVKTKANNIGGYVIGVTEEAIPITDIDYCRQINLFESIVNDPLLPYGCFVEDGLFYYNTFVKNNEAYNDYEYKSYGGTSSTTVSITNPSLIDKAPALVNYGGSYEHLPSGQDKLFACEGDCDFDSDCSGNLLCFQRTASQPVPGCSVGGTGDVNEYDYCYDPEALITVTRDAKVGTTWGQVQLPYTATELSSSYVNSLSFEVNRCNNNVDCVGVAVASGYAEAVYRTDTFDACNSDTCNPAIAFFKRKARPLYQAPCTATTPCLKHREKPFNATYALDPVTGTSTCYEGFGAQPDMVFVERVRGLPDNSVSKEENFRHNAYVNVWSALHKMQK